MKPVRIDLREHHGIPRTAEPVRIGVPLAAGVVHDPAHLQLRDSDGKQLPFDTRVTARWPDGSIRWCLLDVAVSVAAQGEQVLLLEQTPAPTGIASAAAMRLIRSGESLAVDTGATQFDLPAGSALFHHAALASAQLELATPAGNTRVVISDTATERDQANARLDCTRTGWFVGPDDARLCRFESRLAFFAGSSTVRWDFTIHNPNAAQHPGGLWDLGDPGSLFFRQLNLTLTSAQDSPVHYQLDAGAPWLTADTDASLQQYSSGGAEWNSRNHIDHTGVVPLHIKGYQFRSGQQQQDGLRASPLLHCDNAFSVGIDRFWQNFPKAITRSGNRITLHLFPAQDNALHELQGGESKTHTLYFDFSGARDALAWTRTPLAPALAAEQVATSNSLLHFSARSDASDATDDLIQLGLDAQVGFQAKREIIDEYGWRHFGDIFADHESLYLPPGELYISHYNNQYDPLYGFLRQYLLSGNSAWWTLAHELARHVTDIDIYNTQADRAEYNGGLFWHTDHYVDAFTASHRTYSRQQKPNGKDVTQGGGPGAEHCYTQGLLLHYYLSGSERSRQAVLTLTQWITHFYEGTGTLVEQLAHIKSKVLPKLRNGGTSLSHTYPLNRGVGNYINALLDSLAITDNRDYLRQVEHVIRHTVHPRDRIEDRHFDDIESHWFYTILLQAVIRYLEIKRQRGEDDDASRYALDSVLHYANWMARHEQPYLHTPERLEFPNDTWAAQDIRKANILFFASQYGDAEQRTLLRSRAEFFSDYVRQHLAASDTRHFSRILAILMQNHGASAYFSNAPAIAHTPGTYATEPYVTRGQLLGKTLINALRTLARFSLRRELQWLKFRHPLFLKAYHRLYSQ